MVSFAPTEARNRTLPFVPEELRQLLVGVTDHRPLCSFLPPIPPLLPSLPTLATACDRCGLQCAVWHLSEGGFPRHGQEPVGRVWLLLEATDLLPCPHEHHTRNLLTAAGLTWAIPTTHASRVLKTSLGPCVFYTASHAHIVYCVFSMPGSGLASYPQASLAFSWWAAPAGEGRGKRVRTYCQRLTGLLSLLMITAPV